MKLIWIPLPREVLEGQRDKKKLMYSKYFILGNKRGGRNKRGQGAKFLERIHFASNQEKLDC